MGSTLVLQLLADPQPPMLEGEADFADDSKSSSSIPTPQSETIFDLGAFESLPAADPGSARPFAAPLCARYSLDDAIPRGRQLLEPLCSATARRASSEPAARRRASPDRKWLL